MSVDWGLSGAVVLTGLVLVFVILLVLIMTVEFTSRVVNSAAGSGKASTAKAVSSASVPKKQYAAAPAVQAGIEEETVAAIMAAVSCMTDQASGAGYAVRSINRAKSDRPVWGFAGMQQNTRPF